MRKLLIAVLASAICLAGACAALKPIPLPLSYDVQKSRRAHMLLMKEQQDESADKNRLAKDK